MNFAHLEYFRTVVQCGSISKAAEKLYMDRGNLSAAITTLEKEYGVPLLLRTSKGVSLTEFGKDVYRFAEHVLNEQEKLKQLLSHKISAKEKSELLIFFPDGLNTVSFFELFNSFKEKFPYVALTITETPAFAEIFQTLPEELPFIYFFVTTENEIISSPQKTNLVFHLIEQSDVFAYCTEEHILAQYKSVTINTLKDFQILLYSSFLPGFKASVPGIDSSQINSVSNFSLFKHMLSSGKFVTIGSNRKNSIDMREFVRIPFSDNTKFSFYVAVKQDSLNVPVIKSFLNFFFDYENLPFPKEFQ